jgi:hypothetical protein
VAKELAPLLTRGTLTSTKVTIPAAKEFQVVR